VRRRFCRRFWAFCSASRRAWRPAFWRWRFSVGTGHQG